MGSMKDWAACNPHLHPPFDEWPAWAVELDVDLADMAGDCERDEETDELTVRGAARLAALGDVRALIVNMVKHSKDT